MALLPDVELLGFGGLIRYHRLSRGMSQFRVCRASGWQDVSRLSRLESGTGTKPDRETVEKICVALDLEPDERGDLLLAGGYVPTDDEIERTVEEAKSLLDSWNYPSYFMDFTWRTIEGNDPIVRLFGISEEQRNSLRKAKPGVLQLIFDPAYGIQSYLKGNGWEGFAREQVTHFKMEHRTRVHQPWFQDLVRNLNRFEDFRRAWNLASITDTTLLRLHTRFTVEVEPGNPSSGIEFHSFNNALAVDPRFQIARYVPANEESFTQLKALMVKPLGGKGGAVARRGGRSKLRP